MASLSKILIIVGSSAVLLLCFFGGGGAKMLSETCTNPSGWALFVIGTLYQIGLGVVMPMLLQRDLPLEARNAMQAAGAFLTPISEGFSFIEDSVTVQISQAMGAGDLEFAQLVLGLGTAGGFCLGVVGACLMTVLACVRPVLEALVAPGHERLPGCGLSHGPEEIAAMVQLYWLTCVWGWPLSFANNAMTGYLLGLRNVGVLGIAMVSSGVLSLLVWVIFSPKTVSLAGWSGFSSSAAFAVICVVSIGVSLKEGTAAFGKDGRARFWGTGREVLKDDLKALVLDLSLQLGITVGTYVAGSLGVAVFYQLSALQSAMPMYGAAQTTVVNYILKLSGGALVGAREYTSFRMLCAACLLVAGAFAVLALASVIPFRYSLAFYWGTGACSFASSAPCLPVYKGVFGGEAGSAVPLQDSMIAMALAAGAQSVYSVAKAGLYCCSDYTFMAWSAFAVFMLVFMPLVLIAKYVVQQAVAVYFAMYCPYMVLAVLFTLRLFYNTHRMLRGRPGPWEKAGTSKEGAESRPDDAAADAAAGDAHEGESDTGSEEGSSTDSEASDIVVPPIGTAPLRSTRRSSMLTIPELAEFTASLKTLPSTGAFRHSLAIRR